MLYEILLAWSKSSFRVFHKVLGKNPNKLFGQPNISIHTMEYYQQQKGQDILGRERHECSTEVQ